MNTKKKVFTEKNNSGAVNSEPAVFLDRDGTLVEDRGYLRRPSEVFFFDNTVSALLLLQQKFRLFIVTNQTGIGEGFIDRAEVKLVNDFIMDFLFSKGIIIEQIYCCPHRRADKCDCMKPNPYFIRKAAGEYGIDVQKSFVVGDHPCDVEMAINAGATGVFVLSGHGRKHRAEIPSSVAVVEHIGEAATFIAGK